MHSHVDLDRFRGDFFAETLAAIEAAAHAGRLESTGVSLEVIWSEHLAVLRELELIL